MKTIRTTIVLLMVFALAAVNFGCLDEKVIEIVVTGETCAVIHEDEDGSSPPDPEVLDFAQEIRDILDDAGYSVDDIIDAFLMGGHYGTVNFDQQHDWTVSGAIQVQRSDISGPVVTIINYASQSVQAALNQKIPAPLEQAGVDVINDALTAFLAGESPVLTFYVVNGSIAPTPSPSDRMIFDWKAWISIQVILEESLEVPDPF